MRRAAVYLTLALVLAACSDAFDPPGDVSNPSLQVAAPTQGPERVMAGRIVARFQEGVSVSDVAGAYGLTVERPGHGNAFHLLRGAPAGSERSLAARMGSDPRIVFAEPDYLRQPTAIDSRLWAFYNPGGLTVDYTRGRQKGRPVNSYKSADDADEDNIQDYASGGSEVRIGSIDTGVDFDHPEFGTNQLIAGTDWIDGGNPDDGNGHGTHTTGTMVGQTVGVAGVSGAGVNVQVYVQRVCGSFGCPTSAIADAIREATDSGVVAMNLSLGGPSLGQAEAEAIDYATANGALVIASAGNNGSSTISCPACDPDAISVAATNWRDELAYYTNYGVGLDISAPGGELYSNTTDEAGIYSAYLGGGYAYLQGTSMAAPQVTGTAGIVASVTGLTGDALRSRLEGSTDDLGTTGYDTSFGHGRLNSYRAVTGTTLDESSGGGDNGDGGSGGGGLTASFTYDCGNSDTCNFDAGGSTGATSYDWEFGDGGGGTGVQVSHTYSGANDFTVMLTVGDGSGTVTANQTVSCTLRGPRLRCK